MARKRTAATDTKRAKGSAAERLPRKPVRLSIGAPAPRTITVRVPLKLRKRGGRKLVLTPSGTTHWRPLQQGADSTIVKALARAHRWKQMLESGKYASVTELAVAEKINDSYVCRMLRLTLLAPDVVEAVLDGRPGPVPELAALLKSFPAEWNLQRKKLAVPAS